MGLILAPVNPIQHFPSARNFPSRVRNALFVALTRSLGWVHLSGLRVEGQTAFYEELAAVLAAEGTFEFQYRGKPKRVIDD